MLSFKRATPGNYGVPELKLRTDIVDRIATTVGHSIIVAVGLKMTRKIFVLDGIVTFVVETRASKLKSGHGVRVPCTRYTEESAVIGVEQTGPPFNRNWNRRSLTNVRVQALFFP